MKIRCKCCGKKFNIDVDDSGIPRRDVCDKCLSRKRERELTSEIAGVGKKKSSWWKR